MPDNSEDGLEERRRRLGASLGRIRADDVKEAKAEASAEESRKGFANAMKLSSEFISAIIVGVALGWAMDWWPVAVVDATRRQAPVAVTTLVAARTVAESPVAALVAGRTRVAIIATGGVRTDAAGLVAAGALLRVPALLLHGSAGAVLRLRAVPAVARALGPGLAGGRLAGTALRILVGGLLRAVARFETLRAASAGGLLVLGHGESFWVVSHENSARPRSRGDRDELPGHPSAGAIQ